ncbi:MAG: NAD(P)H-binding protein [Nevskia sp.]|nr:NAD(P)H-binding protein [Nevskia sp.]
MARTALIAGSTGLIGRFLLQKLLDSPEYGRVVAVTRRPLDLAHPKLVNPQNDLEQPQTLGSLLAVDDVFCCLGTTTAKSGKAGLERVDHGMVVDLARAARGAGASRFVVVSAIGASATSPAFYSRVKAHMERDVAALGYPTVHILQPSLLLGARAESRPAEAAAQIVSPLLAPLCAGPLARYRPVRAEEVAAAMLVLALRSGAGVQVHRYPFT